MWFLVGYPVLRLPTPAPDITMSAYAADGQGKKKQKLSQPNRQSFFSAKPAEPELKDVEAACAAMNEAFASGELKPSKSRTKGKKSLRDRKCSVA